MNNCRNNKPKFASKLAQVKGLGAAKNGSHHWVMQRLSAILLIPLAIWFVVQLLQVLLVGSEAIVNILNCPIRATVLIAFFSVASYHGMVGFKVILEDYISCLFMRTSTIILLYVVTIFSWIAAIVSIIIKYKSI
ncbi:MAG: succinate dehydrogenase, hydrophobic membrane anchor protein [Pseudomonadota bacterium]